MICTKRFRPMPSTLPARPMPRASAQVEPYVECLGAELAMQFLL